MTNSDRPARPSHPAHPVQPPVADAEPSPGQRWLTEGETMNPAPQTRSKDGRDTATGCRDRASADLAQALAASTANGRRVLETSAASWNSRADLLQRIETGIEARLATPDAADPKLTRAEIAEDAAQLRL